MRKHTRPAWMEVDLDNLAYNCREVKKLFNHKTLIMAVIKANGEGHGAVRMGETLLENGVDRFGVATLSEAIQLRRAFKNVPILVLGYTPRYSAADVINYDITQTIFSYDDAQALSSKAMEIGREARIHIKLDTGMNRIGMKIEEKTIETIKNISTLPNIFIEGIFTHFAVSDEDKDFTYKQVERFKYICDGLESLGLKIPIKHVSNSAAVMEFPEFNFDMVRPGRVLYGYCSSRESEKNNIVLKKVMSMKAEICQVKEVETGEGISYGLTYKTSRKSKIATLPLGYGDGFTGLGDARVLIKGKEVPVVGRITMDMSMVDVTGLDVNSGDEAIIFGSDGENSLWLEEYAPKIGILSIGILLWSSPRVPREYIKGGEVICIDDYILNL